LSGTIVLEQRSGIVECEFDDNIALITFLKFG